MAHRLATGLAEAGTMVVSGLARGIDATAHAASLDHGTMAVHAGGVGIMYPAKNSTLAKSILTQGARLSEQPLGCSPTPKFFPKGNRLISGLCRAMVVVETAAKLGTFMIACQALNQGRHLLAVAGHPIDAQTAGSNMLIRDGAYLVRSVTDISQAFHPSTSHLPPDTL
jgi:DNA processing protein